MQRRLLCRAIPEEGPDDQPLTLSIGTVFSGRHHARHVTASDGQPEQWRRFDDARPAEPLDGRVIGLGEATHGSREFTAIRARLTARLCDRGVRGIALEAGAGSVVGLDRYVTSGTGRLADALDALPAFWQTESFAAVCRWLRARNADRPSNERVRLYGVDVDAPAVIRDAIGPADSLTTDASLPETISGAVPAEQLAAAERVQARLADRLDEPSPDERYLLDALRASTEWLQAGGASDSFEPAAMATRDRVMARNTARLADRHALVVWAHNWHLKRGSFGGSAAWGDEPTAGDRLADRFGDDYQAIGTDFVCGGFRAGTPDSVGLVACAIEEPVADTVAARLDPAVPGWTVPESGERVHRVGLSYDGRPATDDATAFDGVVCVRETRPTRPFDA